MMFDEDGGDVVVCIDTPVDGVDGCSIHTASRHHIELSVPYSYRMRWRSADAELWFFVPSSDFSQPAVQTANSDEQSNRDGMSV